MKRIVLIIFVLQLVVAQVMAQHNVEGNITDQKTGEPIPMATAQYKGHNLGKAADAKGYYRILRKPGWPLTFSAVGYQSKTVNVKENTRRIDVNLKPDNQMLQGVTVKAKRQRYKRKNNPAVEMMRKVIAAKKRTRLENHDYYKYRKYQKMTLAFNNITPQLMEHPMFAAKKWLVKQVEHCPWNDKMILPVMLDETVSTKVYQREPHKEKTIIEGQRSTGINDVVQTGDVVNVVMRDVFTDVDIYENQIRLLQYPFTSPIGDGAIAFYRYYIQDTVFVGSDRCFQLHFLPNNQQDFGFRGDLYVLADSSWQVKRCEMTIPTKSDVNFVENMQVIQEFEQLPSGEWVLSVDDMFTELAFYDIDFLQTACVTRNTRLTDYSFEPVDQELFRGRAPEVKQPGAMHRDADFWTQHRNVELTRSESDMETFVADMQTMKGFNWLVSGLKILIENFVETAPPGKPNKVDLGPVNTLVSTNYIDGVRTRLSAQTTANLHPNLFLKGYVARGWGSHQWYYRGDFTWSFDKKEYSYKEFPQHSLTLTLARDVESPTDKFQRTDKDNVFTALKWSKVDMMQFYQRQQLTYEREEYWGLRTLLQLKTERTEAAGELHFTPVTALPADHEAFRTTEIHGELRYAIGETHITTKKQRLSTNKDAPIFTLGHTLGVKNLLGSDFRQNYTEASIYKRFWLASWGKFDVLLKGGVQWNQVPFPLLCMPETSLSYVAHDYVFQAINNVEFLNDRFAHCIINWDMNGKIFNRIPLFRHLKWREWVSVKCLWGTLTDKNNPYLERNQGNRVLMEFPENSYLMNPEKPYWEASFGVHNILKFFQVEYVHRFNYNYLPTAHRHGVRVRMRMTF